MLTSVRRPGETRPGAGRPKIPFTSHWLGLALHYPGYRQPSVTLGPNFIYKWVIQTTDIYYGLLWLLLRYSCSFRELLKSLSCARHCAGGWRNLPWPLLGSFEMTLIKQTTFKNINLKTDWDKRWEGRDFRCVLCYNKGLEIKGKGISEE